MHQQLQSNINQQAQNETACQKLPVTVNGLYGSYSQLLQLYSCCQPRRCRDLSALQSAAFLCPPSCHHAQVWPYWTNDLRRFGSVTEDDEVVPSCSMAGHSVCCKKSAFQCLVLQDGLVLIFAIFTHFWTLSFSFFLTWALVLMSLISSATFCYTRQSYLCQIL